MLAGLPPSLASLRRTAVMGIVNVTPDSFSDGGRYATTQSAIDHGRRLWDEGADLIDVGGESTRPHAQAVSIEQEQDRVRHTADVLIDRQPLAGLLNIERPVGLLWIEIAQEIPGRIDERIHRVGDLRSHCVSLRLVTTESQRSHLPATTCSFASTVWQVGHQLTAESVR